MSPLLVSKWNTYSDFIKFSINKIKFCNLPYIDDKATRLTFVINIVMLAF